MKISQIFKGIGKGHKIFQPVNIKRKVSLRNLSITKDYDILKKFHDANRKSNRDLIELIYEKEAKEQKLILTKTQTKELNSVKEEEEKKSLPLNIIPKPSPIPPPILKKLLSKETKKVSLLKSMQKQCQIRMKHSISSTNLINQIKNKRYKNIERKISKSISSSRYYESFSKPRYVNILNNIS